MQKALHCLALLLAMVAPACLRSEPAPKGDKGRDDLAYRPNDLSFKRPRSHGLEKPAASANHGRSDASSPPVALAPITSPFVDHFEGQKLGENWYATSSAWRIENGRLCARSARNHPAWLMRRLPKNARITFTAVSDSESGDLKAELWGDGRSGATGISYNDATSYLFIWGGWKNQLHVLARLDEHGHDRLERRVNPASTDPRDQRVMPGTQYHFQIERNDGRTVSWLVDGMEIHRLVDREPLSGPGHEHLGFNDWEAHVCFDDLTIIPLPN